MIDRRTMLRATLLGSASLALPSLGTPAAAQAIDSLKLFIPAAPGGGWDQTGRTIEQVLKSSVMVQAIQFEHAPGAGGAVGLPRFVNNMKGQGNVLMVAGHGDGRRDHRQQGAGQTDPDDADRAPDRRVRGRRRAGAVQAAVDGGPRRAVQGGSRQGVVGRRLGRRHRPHPRRHDGARRSASTRARSTTSPMPAAGRRRPRSSAAMSPRASAAGASSPSRSRRGSCAPWRSRPTSGSTASTCRPSRNRASMSSCSTGAACLRRPASPMRSARR